VAETPTKAGVIAIVDDDAPLREAFASVMKAVGLPSRTFGSAEEFLACDDCDQIACLVLDVRLPGTSGIELQKRLTETDRRLPIIFMTAHGDASLEDSLMRAGAAAFLSKPVRSDRLLKEIRKALDTTQTDKQR
jgi:two-component system, LuxR family, response regulator FixJ